MKTIIKLFAAVLTAVPVLVSCYSEPLPEVTPEVILEDQETGTEQDSTVRVITVSFDTKATRTEFSEPGDCTTRPKFVGDEEIMVAQADGSVTPQRCTISVKNGVASFETTLQGDLVAVYPADCARIGGYAMGEDGPVWVDNKATGKTIGGVIVPSEQTGKFKDANICMANIDAGAKDATFFNQTAVFEIDIPEDKDWKATCITVTSLRIINSETGQRYTKQEEEAENDGICYSLICNGLWNYNTEAYDVITYASSSPAPLEKGRVITIGTVIDSDAPILVGKYYVSVLTDDEVCLCDLNFDVQTNISKIDGQYDSGSGYQGGFSPHFLGSIFGSDNVDYVPALKGAIYTNVMAHLHKYVALSSVKWSTEYLGPEGDSTTDVGYFAWGETTGHKWNEEKQKFEPIVNNTGYTFSWANCPFNQGSSSQNLTYLNSNISTICPSLTINGSTGNTLSLEFDAAYQNWGGAWRMMRDLDSKGFEQHYDLLDTDDPYTISSPRGIFRFTPVGYSDGSNLINSSTAVQFWSSSLHKLQKNNGYYMNYNLSKPILSRVEAVSRNRYIGCAIRPVSGTEIL